MDRMSVCVFKSFPFDILVLQWSVVRQQFVVKKKNVGLLMELLSVYRRHALLKVIHFESIRS